MSEAREVYDRREDLRRLYRGESVARNYVRERFSHPVWGAAARREAEIVNGWLAARQPARIAEVACGPARLSRHLAPVDRALGLDTSPEMLAEAARHLDSCRWLLVRGDAGSLPVPDGGLDMVLTFRFFRHFPRETRARFLAEWRRSLRPGGGLVFEALNRDMGDRLRRVAGLERANCFDRPLHDETWDLRGLREELRAGGFDLVHAEPLLRRPGLYFHPVVKLLRLGGHLFRLLDRSGPGPCYQWQILARRSDP